LREKGTVRRERGRKRVGNRIRNRASVRGSGEDTEASGKATMSCGWANVRELMKKKCEGRRAVPSGEEKLPASSGGVSISLAGKQVSSNTTFLERYILELVGSMHW
jgi:hypothetical protein